MGNPNKNALCERSAWFWFTLTTFPPKGSTGSFTFWAHHGNKAGKRRGAGARTPWLKPCRGGGEAPGEHLQPKDCPHPWKLWVALLGPSRAPQVLFQHPAMSSWPPAPLGRAAAGGRWLSSPRDHQDQRQQVFLLLLLSASISPARGNGATRSWSEGLSILKMDFTCLRQPPPSLTPHCFLPREISLKGANGTMSLSLPPLIFSLFFFFY